MSPLNIPLTAPALASMPFSGTLPCPSLWAPSAAAAELPVYRAKPTPPKVPLQADSPCNLWETQGIHRPPHPCIYSGPSQHHLDKFNKKYLGLHDFDITMATLGEHYSCLTLSHDNILWATPWLSSLMMKSALSLTQFFCPKLPTGLLRRPPSRPVSCPSSVQVISPSWTPSLCLTSTH